jgi:hypothetical protein
MVYPESGAYKRSVIFYDMDGDGDEEALAMYTCDSESVNIMLADNNNNSYSMLYETEIPAATLKQVEFVNFGSDSCQILLSYPGMSTAFESLTLLTVGEEVAEIDKQNPCSAHLVGDYNGDGTQDLLTLALSDGENLPMALLYTGANGALTEQSECEIASDVKEYLTLSFGKISDEVSGAVVDARDADGQYTTQLICFDYNARGIINPLYVSSIYNKTKRSAQVVSADIDRDGVIEIPICKPMDYSQNEESSAVCDRIDWSSYDYTQLNLVVKQSAILCDRLGFLLNLSPGHSEIVTARYTGENSMAIFLWEYKHNTPERTSKLVTIKRYDRSSFNKSASTEAIAAENNAYIYTYVIEPEVEYYGYTDDEITDNIVLIENTSFD